MAKAKVFAGVCGFKASIVVEKLDDRRLEVRISSPCEMVKELGNRLDEIGWKKEFSSEMCNTMVYIQASKCIKHIACPVPAAILKAIEVEAGLALPKDVEIKLEK